MLAGSKNSDGELTRAKRRGEGKRALVRASICLFSLLLLSFAWRLTPLKDSVDFQTIIDWQESLKGDPAVFFWVVGTYLIGGLVLFPVTLLNLATVATFGPVIGNAYAFAGWLCSAAVGFGIGRFIGRELAQKFFRSSMNRLLDRVGRHGFLTVLGVRLLPIAPFTVGNLLIGASGIRFRDFCLATVVGRIPGVVALTLFGMQFETFLRRPSTESLILLALALLGIPVVVGKLCKRVSAYDSRLQNTIES